MVVTLISQLYHLLKYEFEQSSTKFEKGMLIISIDIDVGNRKVGLANESKNDANVHNYLAEYEVGAIEETALPLFVDLFDHFHVPVTFAVRGQLLDVEKAAMAPILKASVKHDIGSHGYSHKSFKGLSRNEAEMELNMTSRIMEKLNIVPKSFVFPKNMVAHLDLLEEYGYKCYREYGDFIRDGMYIEKRGQLYDIHPSLYLDQNTNYIPLKKILDICVHKKLPFHVWFHLWDFGQERRLIQKAIRRIFFPFLGYAKGKANEAELTFETMLSAIERAQACACS